MSKLVKKKIEKLKTIEIDIVKMQEYFYEASLDEDQAKEAKLQINEIIGALEALEELI